MQIDHEGFLILSIILTSLIVVFILIQNIYSIIKSPDAEKVLKFALQLACVFIGFIFLALSYTTYLSGKTLDETYWFTSLGLFFFYLITTKKLIVHQNYRENENV
jgi:nitric oxide reductase large subunit